MFEKEYEGGGVRRRCSITRKGGGYNLWWEGRIRKEVCQLINTGKERDMWDVGENRKEIHL